MTSIKRWNYSTVTDSVNKVDIFHERKSEITCKVSDEKLMTSTVRRNKFFRQLSQSVTKCVLITCSKGVDIENWCIHLITF